jgi:hypothetical protein
MRKVVVQEWMTLDGVVQAPGAADEDTSGGFQYGGWHLPYFDDLSMKWVLDKVSGAGGFLLGRAPTSSSPRTGRTPPRQSSPSPSR